MSHKRKNLKRNPPKLKLANKLQPYQLARCYRIIVTKPKH